MSFMAQKDECRIELNIKSVRFILHRKLKLNFFSVENTPMNGQEYFMSEAKKTFNQ